jgi:hypothetical protein
MEISNLTDDFSKRISTETDTLDTYTHLHKIRRRNGRINWLIIYWMGLTLVPEIAILRLLMNSRPGAWHPLDVLLVAL